MRYGWTRQGECAVRARWVDGALARWGETVDVDILSANQPIELVVDDAPVAGLGVSFRVEEYGVDVLEVLPGSPADRAGLTEGMTIVSVDGVETTTLSPEEFLALGLGREGSLARITVESGDETWQVEFRRERIEESEG
jgi:C-terminal processing protease CtpA/Prc